MLGQVPVRAREADAEVGGHRPRRPHLGAGDHPGVAVAGGASEHTGEVRAGSGLGEQLHPKLLAAQDLRYPVPLLLFAPVCQEGGSDDAHRHPAGDASRHGHGVAARLLTPDLLMGRGQPPPPVLLGDQDADIAGVIDLALHGSIGGEPLGGDVALRPQCRTGFTARQVGGQPLAHRLAIGDQVVRAVARRVVVAHLAVLVHSPWIAHTRSRCHPGSPYIRLFDRALRM